jgi:DNA-directed RNA polymerase subunit RPC12/RpoP
MRCKKCKSEAIVGTSWGVFYCLVCNSKEMENIEPDTYEIPPFDPEKEMPCYNEDQIQCEECNQWFEELADKENNLCEDCKERRFQKGFKEFYDSTGSGAPTRERLMEYWKIKRGRV